ncbi:hypothetical protein KKE60_04850, partial [Patescibacteria group bacterium]|nr:hypothetical protein [Patescibacteria group bacterium]
MDKVIEILNELLNIPDRSADGEYYKPHTDDEIKKASQAIDALYQGDEEGLLSDEQIQDAIESHPKLFLQDFHFQRLMLAARQVRDAQ